MPPKKTAGGVVSYSSIRSGRQKVSKAKANDLAATARLKYTGIPGLELAVTVTTPTGYGARRVRRSWRW